MNAINLLSHQSYEVYKSDNRILSYFTKSSYYIKFKTFTGVLILTHKKIPKGHDYMHYEIYGNIYECICTSKYEDLKELDRTQLSLEL